MPVAVETLRDTRKVSIVFFVSVLLAFGSLVWMALSDYARPWRTHQNEDFNAQALAAEIEVRGMESGQYVETLNALKEAVKAEEAKLESHSSHVSELTAEENELVGALAKAGLGFGNANALIAVTRFEYEELLAEHGPNHELTIAKKAKLDADTAELDRLRIERESVEDRLKVIRGELKSIHADYQTALSSLESHKKKKSEAERRVVMLRQGVLALRNAWNMPWLDFIAPFGTPGRNEIKQVVLDHVRQDYTFVESYTIDRCVTCHIAVNRPEASLDQYGQLAEGAMRSLNEVRVSEGRKPVTITVEEIIRRQQKSHGHGGSGASGAHGAASHSGEESAHDDKPSASSSAFAGMTELPTLDKMTYAQKKEYVASLTQYVNEYADELGLGSVSLNQPLLAHPNLELYVMPNSPHPMSKMGCTVCHQGSGEDTDFVYAAHQPTSHAQEQEWKEKYYVLQAGLPMTTFETIEHYWEKPIFPPQHTEASCSKCHTEVYDLVSYRGDATAPRLTRGRELFTQVGCINCHLVEGIGDSRRVGPELHSIGKKVSTGWLQRWIDYPRDFRPSTLMPHFFGQENNIVGSESEADPNPVLRTETEVQAIAHFLESFTREFDPLPLPEGITGDPQRGHKLFTETGCLACHSSLAAVDPADSKGRTFGRHWIEEDLIHGGASAEDAADRVSRMTLNEQSDYAQQHFTNERHAEAMRELYRLRAMGEDTDNLYLPPEFTRFAPELSGIGTKLVSDANNADDVQRGTQWLYNWLREPHHYNAGSKMPRLFRESYYWKETDLSKRRALADQDLMDLSSYLLTLRHDTFESSEFAYDGNHQEMTTTLIKSLLAGQYSDAAADDLLNDRVGEGVKRGPMSEAIVSQVKNSVGEEKADSILAGQSLEQRRLLYLGQRMITHYGCYACHSIPGFENASRPGTELTFWGEKLLAQLDFAFFSPGFEELREHDSRFHNIYPDGPKNEQYAHLTELWDNEPQELVHNRAAFAYHKLRNPRIFDRAKLKGPYEKLKMPNFMLSPQDSEALTTYVLSRLHPLVTDDIQVDYAGSKLGGIAAGRALVAELNCIACHRIEDNEPVFHQYLLVDDPSGGKTVDENNGPPWLHGEGSKLNHQWFHVFLQNVEMLRPWLNVRMPTFHLTETQATTLVEYFAMVSKQESSVVREKLAKVHDFVTKAERRAEIEGTKPQEDRTPGDDWIEQSQFETIRKYMAEYAKRYRLIRPSNIDPSDNSPADLAYSYKTIIGNTDFLSELYDVNYPFVASPRPEMSPERFALGEQMILEMKCLACHVFGDPSAEGANPNPSAPNLSLTHQRLRREWLRAWLQYPNKIQPGTRMPQWWGDGGSLANFPKEMLEEFANKYGPTPDAQMTLLEDFIYEAGYRNHTVIDPTVAASAVEEGGDDVPFDDGEAPEFDENEFDDFDQ